MALSLPCCRSGWPDRRLPTEGSPRQESRSALFQESRTAVRQHGLPDKVTIDKSGADTAAIEALQEETGQDIEIRQSKYLNNLIEQDHRTIKRIVRPMIGFKTFNSACCTLCGIELMHMIKKGQMFTIEGHILSVAEQFCALTA